MSLQSLIGMFKDKKCPVCDKPASMKIGKDGPLFCSTLCYEEWFQPSKKKAEPQALECKNCDMKIQELVKESFCSVRCYNEYNEPCTACGEEGADVNGLEQCNNRCIDQCARKPQVPECFNCQKEITELVKEHFCSIVCYNEHERPCINCGEAGGAPLEEDGPLFCSSTCYDQWNEKQREKQEEKRENELASVNNGIKQRLSEIKQEIGQKIKHITGASSQGVTYIPELKGPCGEETPELIQGIKRKAAPEPEEDAEERAQKRSRKNKCGKCQREFEGRAIVSLVAQDVKFCSTECASDIYPFRCENCDSAIPGIREGRKACNAKCAAEYDKKKQQSLRRSKRDHTSSNSEILLDRFQSALEKKLQALPTKVARDTWYRVLLTRYNTLLPNERQGFIAHEIDEIISAAVTAFTS